MTEETQTHHADEHRQHSLDAEIQKMREKPINPLIQENHCDC